LYYSPLQARINDEKRQILIKNATGALSVTKKLSKIKAEKIIKGVSKYFVITEKNGEVNWRLDKVSLNQAKKKDGKFCLMTNLNKDCVDIYNLYFSKDKIEKGFRYMKQDISLHPTRKRLTGRVICDVFVCHVAYLLLLLTQQIIRQEKIDVFWDELSSECKEIRLLEYQTSNKQKKYQIVSNNDLQRIIVDKIPFHKQLPLYTT
jgi:hypothetical protein